MIEKIVLDYLNEVLDVPVLMQSPESYKKPTENPTEFVRLEKTGSSRSNHIFTATFAIQSYSDTLYNAALLNEKVKEAMSNIITLDAIASEDLNSDYNFTDTSTKQPRYQAVFELVHY